MPKKELRLRISYEANRLANVHLADAYEVFMPTIRKHSAHTPNKNERNKYVNSIEKLGGKLK
jgi:hypothetical protein